MKNRWAWGSIFLLLYSSCIFGFQDGRSLQISTSSRHRQWGIIIGPSQHIGLPELPNANRAVKEFVDFLVKVGGTVRQLENATLYRIRRAFEEVRGLSEPIDVLYVYFAGFAVGDEREGYFLAKDVELERMPSRSLTLRELQSKLEDNPAKHLVLVVEAVHHPMLGRSLGISDRRENRIIEHLKRLASEKLEWVTVMAMLSEVNGEKGGVESVLTRHLVRGLEGEADSDRDGVVRMHELLRHVREGLAPQAERSPWSIGLVARADPALVAVSQPVGRLSHSVEHPHTGAQPNNHRVEKPAEPHPSKEGSCQDSLRDRLKEAERDPSNLNTRRALAQGYKQVGCFEEAIREYQFILSKLDRDQAWVHNELAQVYEQVGRFGEAEREYHRAIELKPESPDLYFNLGQLYYKAKSYAKAIEEFNRALELNPSNPAEIYYCKGLAHYAEGDYAGAIRNYEAALKLDAHRTEIHYAKGLVYHKQRKYEESIRAYDAALKLDPSRAEIYYVKGLAYDEQGNVKEAISQYKKALELDPMGKRIEYERVRKRLAELEAQGVR